MAAIQSLAGIYIHDYTGTAEVRERVNERFSVAEARLTELLNEPMSEQNADEIITIACLLSMQDVSSFSILQLHILTKTSRLFSWDVV